MLGRDGCHLCEQALAIITEVCTETGVDWREVDIDTDPDLLAKYRDDIPVTFVDGELHDTWHVNPARLRRALAS